MAELLEFNISTRLSHWDEPLPLTHTAAKAVQITSHSEACYIQAYFLCLDTLNIKLTGGFDD